LELHHAIQWIHKLQLIKVDFEVDSKKVADYFNRGGRDITEFGFILDNCIQFCNSCLRNSHVEFIRRQANIIAHELAKTATFNLRFRIFDQTYITNLIFNEIK